MEEFIDYHKNLWEREAEAIREEEYEERTRTNRDGNRLVGYEAERER